MLQFFQIMYFHRINLPDFILRADVVDKNPLDFFNGRLYNIHHEVQRKGDDPVAKQKGTKQIASNRKAFHEYFVIERYEAGISLSGTEVKSIRAGAVNLKDCYCNIKDCELFVYGMHISPYEQGNIFNRDPLRVRKLLMHKKEILKLHSAVSQKGYTLIPLSLYFKDSKVKVELGLCKGKQLFDKRDSEAAKQAVRDEERYRKNNYND